MYKPYSLEEVADRMAIYDLYSRYVNAVDDQQFEVLENEIFLPDTLFDFTDAGHTKGDWKSFGKADYIRNAKVFTLYYHLCANIRIDFDGDDKTAHVKSKTICPHGVRDEKTGEIITYQVVGGYSDVLTKTDKGWRIKERRWNLGWTAKGCGEYVKGSGGLLATDKQ